MDDRGDDGDTRWVWHDQRGVTWAAGLAAVALVGLLVMAVVQTSTGSSPAPDVVPSATSVTTRTSTAKMAPSTPPSTSYTVPSAQTSELNPGSAPSATTDEPAPDEPTSTSTWAPTNPYNNTPTPTNAGHV